MARLWSGPEVLCALSRSTSTMTEPTINSIVIIDDTNFFLLLEIIRQDSCSHVVRIHWDQVEANVKATLWTNGLHCFLCNCSHKVTSKIKESIRISFHLVWTKHKWHTRIGGSLVDCHLALLVDLTPTAPSFLCQKYDNRASLCIIKIIIILKNIKLVALCQKHDHFARAVFELGLTFILGIQGCVVNLCREHFVWLPQHTSG